nr:hypothetical protein KPHV_80060 [Kitasatospora purpeofusca]
MAPVAPGFGRTGVGRTGRSAGRREIGTARSFTELARPEGDKPPAGGARGRDGSTRTMRARLPAAATAPPRARPAPIGGTPDGPQEARPHARLPREVPRSQRPYVNTTMTNFT